MAKDGALLKLDSDCNDNEPNIPKDYMTAELKDALYAEGLEFCMRSGIPIAKFPDDDGSGIVRGDDIRRAVGRKAMDTSKYYYVHEIPHVLWYLNHYEHYGA